MNPPSNNPCGLLSTPQFFFFSLEISTVYISNTTEINMNR